METKVILTIEDIDIIVKKLEPYNVIISTAGFY